MQLSERFYWTRARLARIHAAVSTLSSASLPAALPASFSILMAVLMAAPLSFAKAEARADEVQIPGACREPVIAANASALEREARQVAYLLCLDEQSNTTTKIESALRGRALGDHSSAMRQSNPSDRMRADRLGSPYSLPETPPSGRHPPSLYR